MLVRHGETAPNREGRLLGRADPPLTELGLAQAAAAAAALAPLCPAIVVSSPLRRARQTAEAVATACGLDVAVEPRLVEIDYGEWEGASGSGGPGRDWRHDATFRPPGGESLAQVAARVGAWCEESVAAGATIVAVSHVSPIKQAVGWVLGCDPSVAWRMYLAVASITRIAVRDGRAVLVSFNETAHLAGVGG